MIVLFVSRAVALIEILRRDRECLHVRRARAVVRLYQVVHHRADLLIVTRPADIFAVPYGIHVVLYLE